MDQIKRNRSKVMSEGIVLSTEMDPVERLRSKVMSEGNAISQIASVFNMMDDHNEQMNLKQFRDAINHYDVQMEASEVEEIFKRFDRDGSGLIEYKEFIEVLRPGMNDKRKAMVTKAFDKLDKSGDGVLTVGDLKMNAAAFEKREGDKTMAEFLAIFDSKRSNDGKVTKDEFMQCYSAMSAFIKNDAAFALTVKLEEL